MIRRCDLQDFKVIWKIINDGAQAYNGVIPRHLWKDPYMAHDELLHEMRDGVQFWGFEEEGALSGVMGIQSVKDVTLIRHAYVRTRRQRTGIGSRLLTHLRSLASGPILIGTWADASWAIRFYQRHGFRLALPEEKTVLLKTYWTVPDEQVRASVVLVDRGPEVAGLRRGDYMTMSAESGLEARGGRMPRASTSILKYADFRTHSLSPCRQFR